MAGKTVWIAGGVVLAVGVVAYLTYQTPAAPDAAGTIVEAKRAHADGTNSFNPTATATTTDNGADERGAADRTDASRVDGSRADASRSDASRSDASRSDASRSDASRSDASRSDASRTDPNSN
jgi:hypothetical protein